jgi:23S rRNA (cytosine1962-C5)-methyltransferase
MSSSPAPSLAHPLAPPTSSIILSKGRERSVLRHHPWLFSGSIARTEGDPQPGDTVDIYSHDRVLLGRGAYSPTSQIRARLWTHDATTVVDDAFIRARVHKAVQMRRQLVLDDATNCARLIFAEGDGLPGLIVDQYDDTLVMQCQSAGAERVRDVVVQALVELVKPKRIVERADADVRKLEGLPLRTGILYGPAVEDTVLATERGVRFHVDVMKGHKTGFYLDQRDSRARVRSMSRGRRVLNCFSYTGGFALAALAGEAAHTTSVDTSQAALELGDKNARANGFADERHEWLRGDCFDVLRGLHDDGERYDLIVLDPPKFAPSAAHVEKATRGYRDLNHRAFKLLNPGGLLFTFSCSGAIDRPLFRLIAAQAALETHVDGRVLCELGHSPCHPVSLAFPEGEYLKGLALAV